ncbi:hypothetical protein LX32DRAFT_634654 [Colletotrichum zoysiae]|uniref:Uncharacterized protein n=1 Tax=Colletotrichum zoysiae TaxID=1216348 RepID=A0AAD9M6S1_9PEZI|nr:hypothetical protein LX32DRAFT_634654 [Colletotrichum zoysiae]
MVDSSSTFFSRLYPVAQPAPHDRPRLNHRLGLVASARHHLSELAFSRPVQDVATQGLNPCGSHGIQEPK